MAVTVGSRLGPYEILAPLGAGGMGEVYRARDTKLGREVAIKILPAAFTKDADRLARFEREARMLASLNHPNIAALYGVEEFSGSRALILELVEGEDLSVHMHRASRLRLETVTAVARQIADALDAAHERGIVHRDLKPSNIRLTPEGIVKVLDFGIAKPSADGTSANLTHSPTTLGPTADGTLLGTAPYMSPEQARGKPVDKRTDIWAFGCVLYEMLAGKRAFNGETTSDTIAAILERDPDWSALPAGTPPGMRRLLQQCLEKDPKRRLRDIGDARADLADAAGPREPIAAAGIPWLPWSVAAIMTAIAIVIAIRAVRSAPPPFVPPVIERLTFDSGATNAPSLSPDGAMLAYSSSRLRADLDIWIQQTAGGAPLRLTDDPADDSDPDLSPDGSRVVFRSERNGGGIYLVPALGGQARLIAKDARNPKFSPDGTQLAYWSGQFRGALSGTNSSVFVLPLSGGAPRRLLENFVVARNPVWAPDGKSLLVLAMPTRPPPSPDGLDWWRVPIDGGAPTKSTILNIATWRDNMQMERMTAGTWRADGLLLTVDGAIWQIPLSVDSGRPTGPGRVLVFGGTRVIHASASRDGQVVFASVTTDRAIERIPLDSPGPPASLYSDGRENVARASVTGDGSMIVFERGQAGAREIWRKDLKTGQQSMVISVASEQQLNATVSPDGRRIGYVVGVATPGVSVTVSATGYAVDTDGGVSRKLCERCGVYEFLSDNRRIVATIDDKAIAIIDSLTGERVDQLVERGEASVERPSVSPDGRWLSFRRTVGTVAKTFVMPMRPGSTSPGGQEVDEPTTTGRPCGWSADSRTLYLLLDTDGSRCLWSQRVDPSGRLVGKPIVTRHLHEMTNMLGGLGTSLGNAIASTGFFYETMRVRSSLWRFQIPR